MPTFREEARGSSVEFDLELPHHQHPHTPTHTRRSPHNQRHHYYHQNTKTKNTRLQWPASVEERRPVALPFRPRSPHPHPPQPARTRPPQPPPPPRPQRLLPRRLLLKDRVCLARWPVLLRAWIPCDQRLLPSGSRHHASHAQHMLTHPPSGVAVGSSIGHAVGGWFSGGSSAPAEASPQSTDFAAQHQSSSASAAQMQQATGPCANDVTSFRKCMDENQGSLTICGWYLDQLKACQAAAGQY